MTKSNRITTESVPAPQTKGEAELLLSQIGNLQREVTVNATKQADEIATVKERFNKRNEEIADVITSCFKRLYVWAEANKIRLLKGKGKSVRISSGTISWRKTPPKVNVRNTEKVIEQIKAKGLDHLLRPIVEINKEAVLANPDDIAGISGISITSKEQFAVKPLETNVEKVEVVEKI